MRILRFFSLALVMLLSANALADDDAWEKYGPTNTDKKWGFIARAGYTMGATTPIPVPEYVRQKKMYKPRGGEMVGIEAYKMFSKRWGLKTGLQFFHQGFHSEANVKNYHVAVDLRNYNTGLSGYVFEGRFTGLNKTHMEFTGMTVPLLANFRITPRCNVSVGPYGTVFFSKMFHTQSAKNSDGVGYMRLGGPTGPKVEINQTPVVDFSSHLRRLSGGIQLQADYQVMRHMNVFALMDWGLSDAIDPDFITIKYKMHHLYGTIGVAYRY